MMMDPTEFTVIKNYADVFPQLDEIIRKALRQEHVPYSRGQAQTVSAGSLKVPRMLPESLHNNNNETSLAQRQNSLFEHKLRRGYFISALKSCKNSGQQVKKRKALPYEKLCLAGENNFQPALKVHNDSFKAPKTCTKLSTHNSVTTSSGNSSAHTEKHTSSAACQTVDVSIDQSTTNGGVGVKVAVTKAQSTQKSPTPTSDQNASHASQSNPPSNNIVYRSASSPLVNHHVSRSPSSDLIGASPALSSSPSNISVTKITSSGITSQTTSSECNNVASTASSSVMRDSSSTLHQSHGFANKPLPTSADKPLPTSADMPLPTSADMPPPTSGDKPLSTSADNSSLQKKTCVHENNGFYENELSGDSGSNLKPIEIGTLDETEMVKIIETLKKAQTAFDTFPSEKMDELFESQEEFLKRQEKLQKTSVNKGSSPGDVKSLLLDQIVKYFETKILETVRFAKRIPGFLDLPRDDQANLIRESRNESDLISDMRGINAKNKVITSLDGHHFSLEDLKTVYPEETLQCFYVGGQKALKLNPTAEEEALLRAISITFADRCELTCKEKVEDIQNRLISCLLYVIKKQGDPEGVRLGQIMNFLIFCRTMTENELKVTKSIILESEKHASNPFVQEVL